jgi:eukaryotic-like serine/threonine-protein kinase
MTKGRLINGYRILRDFTIVGGGLSKWTFAEKGGKEYFIKEFLSPTYPIDGSPGSESTKQIKRKRCEEFERHHRLLIERLSDRAADGGNLIVTIDFFRHGAKYYKVTDKVDVRGLKIEDIAASASGQKKLILLTVAHSLRILHQAGVVHGDLKPDNILIKESAKGGYVAKLIDFDNSYISGCPPSTEETVGDFVYYSPELLRYVRGDKDTPSSDLQLGSDIFALGLIYSEFLTGELPLFDRKKYQYACEAVNAGCKLSVPRISAPLDALVTQMLHPLYDRRPSIEEVFTGIKSGVSPRAGDKPVTRSALGGTLLKKSAAAGTEDSKKPSSPGGGLSGTLIRRKP